MIVIVVWSLLEGSFLSRERHATPSRRRRAVRRPASMRFAGASWAFRRRYGEDPNGRVRQRGVPTSRMSFLALQIRASTCQQFQDVVGQAAHAVAVRLSPRTVVPSSSGSNGPCSVASAR